MKEKNKIPFLLNCIGIILLIIQFILLKSLTSTSMWKSYITAILSIITIVLLIVSNISSKKEGNAILNKTLNSIIRIVSISASFIILIICVVMWF